MRSLLALVALSVLCTAACNQIFGVDDLVVGDGTGAAGGAGQGTGTTASGTGGDGTGGKNDGCGPGLQDNDDNGMCEPACALDTCSQNGVCDDGSGEAVCACDTGWDGDACSVCATGYTGRTCSQCDTGYQDADDNGTCLLSCTASTCGVNGVCEDASGTAICICKPPFSGVDCSTACDPGKAGTDCSFRIIYGLDLVDGVTWLLPADVPYDIDDAASVAAFDRVAYRLILDDHEVWAEMDAFTTDATMLGIPVDWVWDVPVSDVVVSSFSPNLTSMPTPAAGNIEMWSACYSAGPNGVYDYDDDITGDDCYGSLQVHVGTTTVLAFNSWANSGGIDVGIGNSPGQHPDWTFTNNGAAFTTKRLEVYVHE
ncbi:MAG: hypothetical protein HOV80_08810 [Polyangiaceae bacterium]|nr:hypothetical protein [Polyangiaceae bacterium]